MKAPLNAVSTLEGTGSLTALVHLPKGGRPCYRIVATSQGEAFAVKLGIEEATEIARYILAQEAELLRLLPSS